MSTTLYDNLIAALKLRASSRLSTEDPDLIWDDMDAAYDSGTRDGQIEAARNLLDECGVDWKTSPKPAG